MLKNLAFAVLVLGALIAAWQYGSQRGSADPSSPDSIAHEKSGDDHIALASTQSMEVARAMAPKTAMAPRMVIAPPAAKPRMNVVPHAKKTNSPVAKSATVSIKTDPAPVAFIPQARPMAARPAKKTSKWVKHLSGREAYFTIDEANLKSKPCHGPFGDGCAKPSDTKDLKIVGVVVETNDGEPVANNVLQGQVKSGSYYEDTPVLYVK